jgi:hypothetical protein
VIPFRIRIRIQSERVSLRKKRNTRCSIFFELTIWSILQCWNIVWCIALWYPFACDGSLLLFQRCGTLKWYWLRLGNVLRSDTPAVVWWEPLSTAFCGTYLKSVGFYVAQRISIHSSGIQEVFHQSGMKVTVG